MKVMIIGATSAIAQETAKSFARERAELLLVARSESRLNAIADDLRVHGAAQVETICVEDLGRLEDHIALFEQALKLFGRIDTLLIAHGTLGDQKKCELSFEETLKELHNNALSVISLLTISANYFEKQRSGCIAVISSVAGDRGRQSNYVYGTAKAAVTTFLQGLRGRLAKSNVTVLTIKPGYVATPMTAHLKKGLLTATPQAVGNGIYKAIKQKREVVYLPWFWTPIMFIVRSIPEKIFKRLPL